MQIDKEVAAFILFLFEVIAAFQSQTSFVFSLKVYSRNCLPFYDCIFWAHIDKLVEVPRWTNEDISDIFHVGWQEIHANV